jgi:hypothetical protein
MFIIGNCVRGYGKAIMDGSYDSALERKKFFVNERLTGRRSRMPAEHRSVG